MSKSSIVVMPDKFLVPSVEPLKVFVTTDHDKEDKDEGNGGVVAIARDKEHAIGLIDAELLRYGLLGNSNHSYTLRQIPTIVPYSEIICDADINGGPDGRSKKARAVPPASRKLSLPVLYLSWDHHSYLSGVAGAVVIADSFILAGELLDASLRRRGLLPNSRRSHSLYEFSLSSSYVSKLAP